jgi:hypothetical protein
MDMEKLVDASLLYKQPSHSHLGDCPICYIPFPLDESRAVIMPCCSKRVCHGCDFTINFMNQEEQRCYFCRSIVPESEEEISKCRLIRVEANDPEALFFEGYDQHIIGAHYRAFKLWSESAKLGNVKALFQLSKYCTILDPEGLDEEIFHGFCLAAIAGHPGARDYLGSREWKNNNVEGAVKHWVIAAMQGHDEAIKKLLEVYKVKKGVVSKMDLDAALRAHQAAVDATKSPQRKNANDYNLGERQTMLFRETHEYVYNPYGQWPTWRFNCSGLQAKKSQL